MHSGCRCVNTLLLTTKRRLTDSELWLRDALVTIWLWSPVSIWLWRMTIQQMAIVCVQLQETLISSSSFLTDSTFELTPIQNFRRTGNHNNNKVSQSSTLDWTRVNFMWGQFTTWHKSDPSLTTLASPSSVDVSERSLDTLVRSYTSQRSAVRMGQWWLDTPQRWWLQTH